MPDWLWWLSPVLVAPLAAVAWTAWTGRSRGPEEPADTMRAYGQFRDALGTPLPHQLPGAHQAHQAHQGERPADPAAAVLPEQAGPQSRPDPARARPDAASARPDAARVRAAAAGARPDAAGSRPPSRPWPRR